MTMGTYTVNDVPKTGTMVMLLINRLNDVASVAGTFKNSKKL